MMNIETFSNQILDTVKEQIQPLSGEGTELLSCIGKNIKVIQEAIYDLEQFMANYKFENQQEEIRFFKEIKPVFISQYYYYKRLIAIQVVTTYKKKMDRKSYYEKILLSLEHFVKRYQEFYTYCITNETYLDDKYFTRKGKAFTVTQVDYKFSTGYDDLLARLMTNELLRDYLLTILQNPHPISFSQKGLAWTASKASLIELIYALQSTGAINHSSANIKFLVTTFERLFNINLANHYRVYMQLRNRKKGQTTFLDQLKERLIQRFKESDDFD